MINDLFNMLYWRDTWLFSLAILPLMFILFNRIRQQWQWKKLADEHLHPWLHIHQKQSNSFYSIIILSMSWLCFVIALAGPRLVDWLPPDQHAETTSLIVVLDFSASMNANDAYPSRKQQAIQWLAKSINNKPEHLKIGIVLFAGHAFNLMPATLDKPIILHFIKQLKDLPLPTLGNDLSTALTLAKQQFKANDKQNAIMVLTDGDLSKTEQDRTEITIKAQLKNQSIHFIGFGDNKAVKLPKHNGGFMQINGRAVQSRLQSTWLKQLDALNNVSYQHYAHIKQQTLKQTINLSDARLNQQAQQHVIWHELYQYPLVLAVFFFIISLWRINKNISIQLMLIGFSTGFLLSHSPTSQANENNLIKKANEALNAENYQQAETFFSQVNNTSAAYGEGIACYRQANYKCAARAFSKAAWQAKTDKVRANAVFNLANSYFFLGDYEQATVLFKDAENLGFNAKLAQRNLKFSHVMHTAVLQRIEDIKKIFRRAKWRAAASGNPAPELNNIISEQNNLSINTKNKTQNFFIRQAIAKQVNQQLSISTQGNSEATQWVKTEQVSNQSTAQLLKRLLEMELAIPASLNEPQAIEGKRKW